MKKVVKLTPRLIKKMINEEKQRINKELKESALQQKQKLLKELRLLKKLKEKESKESRNFNALKEMKKVMIKRLSKKVGK